MAKLTRCVFAATLLTLCGTTTVLADNPTPQVPQPSGSSGPPATEPPIVIATPPPVSAPPSAESAPSAGSSGTGQTGVTETGPSVSPTQAASPPGSQATEPSSPVVGQTSKPGSPGSSSGVQSAGATGSTSSGIMLPGSSSAGDLSNPDAGITGVSSYSSVAAQAPAQLSCQGKPQPASQPFLVSPYSGWSEINSFIDHDSPDYAVDGKIVLANGLTADSPSGQQSDLFPSYWSPRLRQYVNYDGHNGYDYGLSYQPVLAAAAGVVSFAGWNGPSEYDGYGQMVLIRHRSGYVTLYGHLSKLEVKTGTRVKAGQEIGISGTTGHSSGPHLHFSVFHNCQVTDPYGWTGSGTDPLQTFDGENATYLWLAGHDPLVLNPPPHWPSYPLGLRLSLPGGTAPTGRLSSLNLPPADRLLLLKLPAPAGGNATNPGIALARTEAQITQEAAALSPFLDQLKSQRLVTQYQVIPAAAAVWVRGTAPASELEGLPGVASLAGVQPEDLIASQTGLAHSVLIQIGSQEAPSLWPVGFRSALHAWRPLVDVVNGSALIAGFALPGHRVIVSLSRGASVPGAAAATGDPQTGGFVVMIHDAVGNPIMARPGDVIQVQCGGRTASVRVRPFSVSAQAHFIAASGPAGATVPISVASSGTSDWTSASTLNKAGMSRIATAGSLAAGTLAVATIVDAAGDQESATGFVPGAIVREGRPMVQGWATGTGLRLRILRRGRQLVDQPLQPAPDGTFQAEARHNHMPFVLRAGDIVAIGSGRTSRRLTLPRLAVSLPLSGSRVQLNGPPGSRVLLNYTSQVSGSWIRSVPLSRSGTASIGVIGGPIAVGDSATVQMIAPTGDAISSATTAAGIVVHAGKPLVTGEAQPGSTVTIRAFTSHGAVEASATAEADPATGAFQALLRDRKGALANLRPSTRIDVQSGRHAINGLLPLLELGLHGTPTSLVGRTEGRAVVMLTTTDAAGHRTFLQLVADRSGRLGLHLAGLGTSRIEHLEMLLTGANGISVLRNLDVSNTAPLANRQARGRQASACPSPVATTSSRHTSHQQNASCTVRGRARARS